MKDGYSPHGPSHEDPGEGCTLRCPRILWGVACESCNCEVPCKDAQDVTIKIEWVRRRCGQD